MYVLSVYACIAMNEVLFGSVKASNEVWEHIGKFTAEQVWEQLVLSIIMTYQQGIT